MKDTPADRKVNILTAAVILLAVVCSLLTVRVFILNGKVTTTDELTVKRINITDEAGNLRMVLSNEQRQHPGIINGKELPTREREAGIIFFNTAGDECGGLVFTGDGEDAGMVLSFDQFGDDQIMQLHYIESPVTGERRYGLQLWDYPKEGAYEERSARMESFSTLASETERRQFIDKMIEDGLLMRERLFIGKNEDNEVGLFICDRNATPRIGIYVDSDGDPKIELRDCKGEILPIAGWNGFADR